MTAAPGHTARADRKIDRTPDLLAFVIAARARGVYRFGLPDGRAVAQLGSAHAWGA